MLKETIQQRVASDIEPGDRVVYYVDYHGFEAALSREVREVDLHIAGQVTITFEDGTTELYAPSQSLELRCL